MNKIFTVIILILLSISFLSIIAKKIDATTDATYFAYEQGEVYINERVINGKFMDITYSNIPSSDYRKRFDILEYKYLQPILNAREELVIEGKLEDIPINFQTRTEFDEEEYFTLNASKVAECKYSEYNSVEIFYEENIGECYQVLIYRSTERISMNPAKYIYILEKIAENPEGFENLTFTEEDTKDIFTEFEYDDEFASEFTFHDENKAKEIEASLEVIEETEEKQTKDFDVSDFIIDNKSVILVGLFSLICLTTLFLFGLVGYLVYRKLK